jgi:hypothetical protein
LRLARVDLMPQSSMIAWFAQVKTCVRARSDRNEVSRNYR